MDVNKPIEKDITIKMSIFARDKQDRVYKLYFHNLSDISKPEVVFLDYSDQLIKGEIINDKVSEALRVDLGISEIKQIEIVPNEEFDIDEIDDPIIRTLTEELSNNYEIVVEVKYKKELNANLGDSLYCTWLEVKNNDVDEEI